MQICSRYECRVVCDVVVGIASYFLSSAENGNLTQLWCPFYCLVEKECNRETVIIVNNIPYTIHKQIE